MIQTDISNIKDYAQKNEGQNWRFRAQLKMMDKTDAEIDSLVIEINDSIH
jgi:hypothetical protein